MPVRTLTVYAYQDLIDQGWRRAGSYLYKPDLEKSCCKAYTIRLNVESFTLDKKQRRLMRRWREFLAGNTPASAGLGGGSSHPGSEDEGPGSPGSGRGGGRGARGAGSRRAGAGEALHGLPSGAPKHGTAAAAAVAAVAAAMGKGSLAKGSAVRSSRPSADGGGGDRNGGGGGGSGSGGGGGPMVVDSPPADAKSGREGKDEEEEARALAEAVLAAAVAEAVAAGELPPGQPLPPPAVRLCTAKQRQTLPADVRLTSSSPFQLAAAARQAADGEAAGPGPSSAAAAAAAAAAGPKPKRAQAPGGGAAMQAAAAALAAALAQRINDALRRPAEAEAPAGGDAGGGGGSGGGVDGSAAAALWRLCRPEAVAAAGHINFRWEAQPPAGAGGAPAGDAGGADGGIPRAAGASAHSGAGHGRKGQKRKQAATGPGPSEGGVGPGLGPGPGRRRSEGADPATSADGHKSPETKVTVAGTGAVGTAATAAVAEQLAVPTGRLEIRLVPSKFIKEEYDLYVRYQTSQHGDEPEELSPRSFTRFLVDSPMRNVSKEQDPGAPESGYGSFHQQYWLDGRLVAVGVVDVLPRCLSSVYLFWDPDLRGLELGRFTALQEIAWTLRAQSTAASLRSYYMGFYIHSCAKMRYKAEYRPSELLCPVKKVWVRITRELLSALDASPFLELSALPGAECRPNLAAPPQVQAQQQAGAQAHRGPAQAQAQAQAQAGVPQPGQPAALVAPAGAGAGAGRGGGAGAADGAAGRAPEAEPDVGGTLVRLPGVPGLAVNVLRLRDLKRLRLFPEDVMEAVEEALRPWLEVVGWAAPSLVYEL
ncbi:hypothetical protein HYH03_004699 [Edaphochlamys debaryana]|uniref:arginyltransferase n=1 Tax=Edaphochlamys debaryana TaxID=47281 RepID=A0A835Y990_9CHLO|nr:hypothetical protein HYH03_004699 [Edaphochlamys debaryana]|eukprot:KAG2497108.1 hypothetical protein HYH03_004699 [Edaphochlamys debaryana]